METTNKWAVRELVALLAAHGVKHVIISPGSRNAPVAVAITRCAALEHRIVIDERSAGFIALGLAAHTRCPVALLCTSGTAMLNYAPAIAEAYYRNIPLVVITADRPAEWIDQDDSQTLRQAGALDAIVKMSIDIPTTDTAPNKQWYINRQINDALNAAVTGLQGPVHINIEIDEPLTEMCQIDPAETQPRVIKVTSCEQRIHARDLDALIADLPQPLRVLVVCGGLNPDYRLWATVSHFSRIAGICVMTEAQSNLHLITSDHISQIDRTLAAMTADERISMAPDVVITIGGALVSRHIKAWLRECGAKGLTSHWSIGKVRDGHAVDCFKCLTRRITVGPAGVIKQLAHALWRRERDNHSPSDYTSRWLEIADRGAVRAQQYVESAPWCDLTAMNYLLKNIPSRWNLQLSNGTPIRYAQLFDFYAHDVDCNRGVSGIDGCTSTALGACLGYRHDCTMLITGDMSMQYDVGALATADMPARLRIVVLNNGGGAIFRFVRQTASLPELDECFACTETMNLRVKDLAAAYGFDYYETADMAQLAEAYAKFVLPSERPAILNVVTDGALSAKILNQYFEYLNNQQN